ncbi:hypothetical protein DCM91_06360 [Chitinophaga costaii]|nr:hypothetical protein DCM91_06360 [Chitinophaga costaii]
MLILGTFVSQAQTNTVEYGQNRVQFKHFKWRYYQSRHFNTYFSQNGLELGKYVAQMAELELPSMEQFMEFTFRNRVNIVVYNTYGEMQQSNIGIGVEWQNTGGVAKLVGNKLIVYYDGDHEHLRKLIREGIARVMLENLLFGEDLGEFAGNAVLLDLPKWFTDGFIAYAAEHWNPDLDDQLKVAIQSGKYNNFNQFAYDNPLLAGHAFWYFIESKYGKDAVPYLMYISRISHGMKKGFEQVLNKEPKAALQDFFAFNTKRFQEDNRRRRQVVKGRAVVALETTKEDFFHFQPNPKNNTYAVVEFKKGVYRVEIRLGDETRKVLLKSGVRQLKNQLDPNYPLIAWNQKGNRLAIIYEKEGKNRLMIYDLITHITINQVLPQYDRVLDMKYLWEYDNSLLLSAVKNGHSDIYTYSISNFKSEQITNDVYDDLDPSFVAFPGKQGIIYSSNRPSATARGSDTTLPHGRYNVFLVDNFNKTSEKQISQLTNMAYGDARLPVQYNTTHFTFVSDANGVRNRYAGFFKTERAGADTLYFVGAEILHNPEKEELDSALHDYGADGPDSVQVVTLTKDSTYTFPITNYQYGIKESTIGGDQGQVSEVIALYDYKRLYKLKVDTNALRRRNVTARPTHYRQSQMHEDSLRLGIPVSVPNRDTVKHNDFFQNEFGNEPADTSRKMEAAAPSPTNDLRPEEPVLKKSQLFPYKLKFATDYLLLQLDNSIIINRYQTYTGPPQSPIQLTDPFNGLIRIGVSDLMEDIKFNGGFRLPLDLNGSEYFFTGQYLKRRFDYKFTYYRKVEKNNIETSSGIYLPGKLKTNLFQGEVRYPFDQVRSIRLTGAIRTDKEVVLASDEGTLKSPDLHNTYAIGRLEYVYDNTINPAINIWHGNRYKVYGELDSRISGNLSEAFGSIPGKGGLMYNMGFDGRHYESIFRNFIWATRVSADMSWGSQKTLYYLGGTDNWMFPKINTNTPVNTNESYAFQTLSVPLRGYKQNVKNGNNVLLFNTELRLPVFATFLQKPISSAFVRNFQVTSFVDIGTAWNKKLSFKDANYTYYYNNESGVTTKIKEGFLGPFAGGYGFGVRSTIAGYFLRLDAGWPMVGFFRGSPMIYFGLGVDF